MRRASQRRAAQAKESGKTLQKDGIVSITLVEGIKMIAMDDNGKYSNYCCITISLGADLQTSQLSRIRHETHTFGFKKNISYNQLQ